MTRLAAIATVLLALAGAASAAQLGAGSARRRQAETFPAPPARITASTLRQLPALFKLPPLPVAKSKAKPPPRGGGGG